MYEQLKNKFKSIDQQEEILGKLNLSSFEFNTYMPHSKSSLNYSSISYLLNDVILNDRKEVIEFGGGISTIYLAKLALSTKSELRITTVDHDENWIQILENILEKENVKQFVEFIHAPMNDCSLSLAGNQWYDEATIAKRLEGKKFDQVIIDGPLAYLKEISLSRYPALPFIANYLSDRNSVFLDDTNRDGELKIIDVWSKKFNRQFVPLSQSAMISFVGSHYNIK